MIEINKQSWHYQLLDAHLGEKRVPINLCPYFWRVVQFGPARIAWITAVSFVALWLLVIGPLVEYVQYGLDIFKWYSPFGFVGFILDFMIVVLAVIYALFDFFRIQDTKFGDIFEWFFLGLLEIITHRVAKLAYISLGVLFLVINPLRNIILYGLDTSLWDPLAQFAAHLWMLVGLMAGLAAAFILGLYILMRAVKVAGPPVRQTRSRLMQLIIDTYTLIHEKLKNKGLCPGLDFVE